MQLLLEQPVRPEKQGMSVVSNVILIFPCWEDAEDKIKTINAALPEGQNFLEQALCKFTEAYGGSKVLETQIYPAAFNYVSLDELLSAIQKVEWTNPELVQLLYQGQNEDKFSLHYPAVKK